MHVTKSCWNDHSSAFWWLFDAKIMSKCYILAVYIEHLLCFKLKRRHTQHRCTFSCGSTSRRSALKYRSNSPVSDWCSWGPLITIYIYTSIYLSSHEPASLSQVDFYIVQRQVWSESSSWECGNMPCMHPPIFCLVFLPMRSQCILFSFVCEPSVARIAKVCIAVVRMDG